MENKKTDLSSVSVEQLTVANTITLEALLSILVKKGLLRADEVIDKVNSIKAEQKEKIN